MAEGGNSLWFNISPPKAKTCSHSSDDELPLLKLKEFEKPPVVVFGQVVVGATATSILQIFNPNKVDLSVTFDKVPAGFTVKNDSINIKGNDCIELEVFWRPTSLGGLRKSVLVNTDLGQRFQFYVQGVCVQKCEQKVKKSSKMSQNRATSKPYSVKKPKVTMLPRTNSNATAKNTESQFLDSSLYKTENLFEELNTNNPLPLTPIRRETFYINPNQRQVLSEVPVYEPNVPIKHLNFDESLDEVFAQVKANTRKNWSPAEPIVTENLVKLPLGNKCSFSSNETVSSTNRSETFAKPTLKNPSSDADIFEDSLNEPKSDLVFDEVVEDCPFIDLKKIAEARAKSDAMYRLIQNRLDSTDTVTSNETPAAIRRSGSFTVEKARSNSDSFVLSNHIEVENETFNQPIEVVNEMFDRRVSTTKKQSKNAKIEDLGLTHDLSHISASVAESSSSGGDSYQVVPVRKVQTFNQTFHGNEKRKMRRSSSLSTTRGLSSPKKKGLSSSVMSPLKKSSTGRVQRSKPFSSFIKPVAQPKLSLFATSFGKIPRHPNLFAAKNMFYDEQWQQKEEKAFVRWLNHIFTPPDGLSVNEEKVKISETWVTSLQKGATADKSASVQIAPDKETLSLKLYTSEMNKNHLRRNAFMLFHSDAMILILHKIEQQVSKKRICIREDRKLYADFGLKKLFLDILLNYNVLWLHIGLEIVFGEMIYLQKSNEAISLSRFILQKFLFSSDIAKEYAHKAVPNLYAEGYGGQLCKHILRKFLFLILFLDKAKNSHIIEHDPCLFNKNAKIKASKDILIAFSCEFLKGEGDITRHLSNIGCTVSWKQKPLEEFNYAVTNLSQDLKCGTRLARLCELLFHSWALTDTLRVPAATRTIKARNVESVLKVLRENGVDLPADLKASDIADGHREHTLMLLWKIIYKTQVEPLISGDELRTEIIHLHRINRLKRKVQIFEGNKNDTEKSIREFSIYKTDVTLWCLLRWCQIIGEMYDVQIENLSVSFSDGRAFCYIIHHYHPDILPTADICDQTLINLKSQTEAGPDNSIKGVTEEEQNRLLKNEKRNLKTAFDKMRELGCIPIVTDIDDMCNTIPDEKVVVTLLTYLNARLTNLGREIRAARTIQLQWRKYKFEKMKEQLKIQNEAALTIQNAFRNYLHRKKLAVQNKAASVIQRSFRVLVAKKTLAELKQQQLREKAVVKIQNCVRTFIAKKKLQKMKSSALKIQCAYRRYLARKLFNRLKAEKLAVLQEKSAIIIQKYFRAYFERKRFLEVKRRIIQLQSAYRGFITRNRFNRLKSAVLFIQMKYRAKLLCIQQRNNFIAVKKAVLLLQSHFRGNQVRKRLAVQQKSAVTIQTAFRRYKAQQNYTKIKKAVAVIKNRWRSVLITRKQRENFVQIKKSAVLIQSVWRGFKVRQELQRQNRSATKIQAVIRGYFARKEYLKQRNAAILLQLRWRAVLDMRKERQQYLVAKSAVIKIQSVFRGYQARKQLQKQQQAAIAIQAVFRGYIARQEFLKKVNAAILLQSKWRALSDMRKERQQYLVAKSAVIKIQSVFRGYQARKQLLMQQEAAIAIQAVLRGYFARKEYLKQRNAAILLQSRWRAVSDMRKERQQYLVAKSAVVKIQSAFRGYQARKQLLKQQQAAIAIQAVFRGYITRQEYLKQRNSAILLQLRWRAVLLMRQERQSYLGTVAAIVKIQAVFRAYKARKEFLKQREAAIKIQAVFRGYITRQEYLKKVNAAILLQLRWRAVLLMRKERQSYLRTTAAIVKIQSIFRAYKARREFLKQREAAIKIQAVFKAYRANKEYLQLRLAAIVLQSRFRAILEMRKQRQQYCKVKSSVMKIQSVFRGFQARKQLLQQRNAAIAIQTAFRRYIAHKRYLNLKKAAIALQSRWRAILAMRKQRLQYLHIRSLVVKLQALTRQYQMRKEFLRKRQAVIAIQAKVRAYITRKNYLKLQQATLVIQSQWRSVLLMREERQRYLQIRNCIIKIQSTFRRNAIRQRFLLQKRSAIAIQSYFRGYIQRRNFLQLKQAVVYCQSKYRSKIAMQKRRNEYVAIKKSAILIQAYFRGHCERQKLRKKISSAIVIQKNFRMFLARKRFRLVRTAAIAIKATLQNFLIAKKQREQYLATRNNVIKLQSHIRGYLARKRYAETLQAIVKIQACFRMIAVQRRIKSLRNAVATIEKYRKAQLLCREQRMNFLTLRQQATLIQAAIRGFLIRRNFERIRNAAIRLQSYWRGYKCRNDFNKTRKAIVAIQRAYRMRLSIERQNKMNRAAIKIASVFKMAIARKKFQRMKNAVRLIEERRYALIIARQNRQQLRLKIHRIIRVQAAIRGYLARKLRQNLEQEKRNLAATKIQAVFKMFVAKKKFCALKYAVLVVEELRKNNLETRRCRKMFLEKRNAAIAIQRFIRSRNETQKCQNQFKTIRSSVIRIQANIRGLLTRRRFVVIKNKVIREKAATKLQALWRGYKARKNLDDSRFVEIRQNLVVANKNFTQAKTLGQMTRDAVRTILTGKVGDIIQALIILEKTCGLSKRCRDDIIANDIMETLLNLIRSCNRSLPHVDVITHCANIFLTMSMFDEGSEHLWSIHKFIDDCLDLMKKFQDRDTFIQNKIATLVFLLCNDNHQRLQELKAHTHAEKTIRKLLETVSRKSTFKLKASKGIMDDHTGCSCSEKKTKMRRRRSIMSQIHRPEFSSPIVALQHLVNLF